MSNNNRNLTSLPRARAPTQAEASAAAPVAEHAAESDVRSEARAKAAATAHMQAEEQKVISAAITDATSPLAGKISAFLNLSPHDADIHVATSRAAEAIVGGIDEAAVKLAIVIGSSAYLPTGQHPAALGTAMQRLVTRALSLVSRPTGQHRAHTKALQDLAKAFETDRTLFVFRGGILSLSQRPWAAATRAILGAMAPGPAPLPATSTPVHAWLEENARRIDEHHQSVLDLAAECVALDAAAQKVSQMNEPPQLRRRNKGDQFL